MYLSIKEQIDKIHMSLSTQNLLKKNLIKLYHNLDLVGLIDDNKKRNLKNKYKSNKTPPNLPKHGNAWITDDACSIL